MKMITDTKSLSDFCRYASSFPYVTVDTEFLRERTYYSKLCLIQLAMPGNTNENAVLIDPLADAAVFGDANLSFALKLAKHRKVP